MSRPSPAIRLPCLSKVAKWNCTGSSVLPIAVRYAVAVHACDPKTLVERMQPILGRFPQIAAAWLFGSAARCELRADSDIDVGLLLVDPKATAADEYELLGELVARLEVVTAPRAVDVILLEHQGPVFAHGALVDGLLICERNRARRIEFTATTVVRAIDFRPTWELAQNGQLASLRRRLRAMR